MNPYSREAEEAVLGSVLIDPAMRERVADILEPEDFFREVNRWVWEAILETGTPDFLTVCEELDGQARLDAVGGGAFITTLITAPPTSVHAEHYARIVADLAERRRWIQAGGTLAALGNDRGEGLDEIEEKAIRSILNVRRRHAGQLTAVRGAVSDYYDLVEATARGEGSGLGIKTGFRDLDKLYRGFARSDMVLLASRPSFGKTSLALCIARNIARRGEPVAFFSLEMSSQQIVQRLISIEEAVPASSCRSGKFADTEWGALLRGTSNIAEWPLYLDDTRGLTPAEARRKILQLRAHGVHPELVVIDYVQRMKGRGRDRYQDMSEISTAIKDLAGDLDVCILLLSQLSRGVEARNDKRPMLSDLRDTGRLEEDADVVMFIYRDEMYNENTERKNIADIIVAKDRNGPTGNVALYFQKHLTRFQDAVIWQEEIEKGTVL